MPIVLYTLGTVPKGLEKKIYMLESGGGAETIQTTSCLR